MPPNERIMIRNILLFTLVLTSQMLSAQKKPVEYILDVDNDHRNSGWYIGVGPTLMLPSTGERIINDTLDSGLIQSNIYNPKAKMKWNFELGGYHIFDRGFVHFIDYGASYRTFEAVEEYQRVLNVMPEPEVTDIAPLALKQSMVGLNVGINRLMGINRYFFVLHNLHLNGNYRLSRSATVSGDLSQYDRSNNLSGDISYKLGFGFRTRAGLLVASGSIPLVSSYDTEKLFSRKDIFHSKYHPLVFSIRYMWLRKQPNLKCPKSKGKSRKKEKLFKRKMNGG